MRPLQVVALWSFAVFGCEETSLGTAHPPLERSDVEDLDLGNGVGTTFSGSYQIVDFDITDCECREGADLLDCDSLVLAAQSLDVEQADGALTVSLVPKPGSPEQDPYRGGINQDGSFAVGAAIEITNEARDPIGVAFDRVEGVFDDAGGFQATWRSRPQFSIDEGNVDCDVAHEVTALKN